MARAVVAAFHVRRRAGVHLPTHRAGLAGGSLGHQGDPVLDRPREDVQAGQGQLRAIHLDLRRALNHAGIRQGGLAVGKR